MNSVTSLKLEIASLHFRFVILSIQPLQGGITARIVPRIGRLIHPKSQVSRTVSSYHDYKETIGNAVKTSEASR